MKKYTLCSETNIGKIREKNEDNFYCDGFLREDVSQNSCRYSVKGDLKENIILGVFDGMGGTKAGEMASYIAAKMLGKYVGFIREKGMAFDGTYFILKANRVVCSVARKIGKSMGSTAILLFYEKNMIRICNLGDSRAYLFRNRVLTQLSVDHTVESRMMKVRRSMGLSLENKNPDMKNTLTQYLGIPEDEFLLEPAVSDEIAVKEKDIYLLCSDGLTGMVTDDRIAEILGEKTNLEYKKMRLVEEALSNGGRDNITVVLLEIG